jgi:hypothetical protein
MKQAKLDAKKVLSEVQPERAFWVNNGPVLKSLGEFAQGVSKLKPAQFAHHVNREKNDFANWVAEVIGDNVLARKLKTLKSPEAMSRAASERVASLKKLVK